MPSKKKNKSGAQKRRERKEREEWNALNAKVDGILTDHRKRPDRCEIVKRLAPYIYEDSSCLYFGRFTDEYLPEPLKILMEELPDHTFIDVYDTKWYGKVMETILPFMTDKKEADIYRRGSSRNKSGGYPIMNLDGQVIGELLKEFVMIMECLPDNFWLYSCSQQTPLANIMNQINGDKAHTGIGLYLNHRTKSPIYIDEEMERASIKKFFIPKLLKINQGLGENEDKRTCSICCEEHEGEHFGSCVRCGEWICGDCLITNIREKLNPDVVASKKVIIITPPEWTCAYCKGSYFGGYDTIHGRGKFAHLPEIIQDYFRYNAQEFCFGSSDDLRQGVERMIEVGQEDELRDYEEWKLVAR